MIFEAINAGHGDCLLLRLPGSTDAEELVLVDGGPRLAKGAEGQSFRPTGELIRRLDMLASGVPRAITLDAVVCTHIDDDHIAGIEWLYQCLSGDQKLPDGTPEIYAPTLWFNSFSKLIKPVEAQAAALLATTPKAIAASVRQGESLTSAAEKINATINPGAAEGLITVGYEPAGFHKAKITVVAPDQKALKRLQKAWLDDLKKKKNNLSPGVAAVTASLPAAKLDQAIPNLSSIAMLVECAGKTILLTGDARGDHVLAGLEQSGKLNSGKLHVNLLKMPHHGAEGNNPPKFLEAVTADHYVFCANGKDQNPDPPVLELVAAQAKTGRKFTMHFTNGDMDYEPRPDGSLPKLGGSDCSSLKKAIQYLQKDVDVNANVTFSFRTPKDPSLIITL